MKKTLLLLLGLSMFSISSLFAQSTSSTVNSTLEIVDLSGNRTVVKKFDSHIEAPNWSRDGKYLIYNSGGLLYKISVDGGEPELINTGEANRLNNDHQLSFDGSFFAVSSSIDRSSKVFVVPYEGGEAKLITPEGPSYLHGISPDGKMVAYCAFRGDYRDIFVMSVDGGEEKQLTFTDGLDDGPEYSPDGNYIWFNSVRSGLMQVWKMKADGSEQTQVTTFEANNWFPHLSPDGKLVSFISYAKGDVDPGSHPANKNVKLYLMNADGSDIKVLVELFGGQGTLNVNSWAPDSKRFAFVSYELKN